MYRRRVFFLLIMMSWMLVQCNHRNQDQLMLVGTYTNTGSKGIYVYKFNPQNGEMKEWNTSNGIENPSFITTYKDYVYAVSETGKGKPGSIYSYKLDKNSGALSLVSQQLTGGDDPCFAETDSSGKFVAVANYSGGSVALFRTDKNGVLGSDKQLIQHIGTGADPVRQQGPHVHETVFSPDQKYLLVPDLGKDRVMVYHFDRNAEMPLTPATELVCTPASGPRHLVFHPTGNWVYLIYEMKPVVGVYGFDNGKLTEVQQVRTTSQPDGENNDGAEVAISPDGKTLYTSQRKNDNTIGIYAIDPSDGRLMNKGFEPSGGKGPRYFTLDPSGKFMLVANQQTNNIVLFKVDKKSGLLTKGGEVKVPTPVCIRFVGGK